MTNHYVVPDSCLPDGFFSGELPAYARQELDEEPEVKTCEACGELYVGECGCEDE